MTRLSMPFLLGLCFVVGAACSSQVPRSASTYSASSGEKTAEKGPKNAAATAEKGDDKASDVGAAGKVGAGSQGAPAAKVDAMGSAKLAALPAPAGKPQSEAGNPQIGATNPGDETVITAIPASMQRKDIPAAGVLVENGPFRIGDNFVSATSTCRERLLGMPAQGSTFALNFRVDGPTLIRHVMVRERCGVIENPFGSGSTTISILDSAFKHISSGIPLLKADSFNGPQLGEVYLPAAGDYKLFVNTGYVGGPTAAMPKGDYHDIIIGNIEIESQDAKITSLGVTITPSGDGPKLE